MKNILLIICVLFSFVAAAQPNYTRINSRYNYLGFTADAFNLPGVGTAALKTAQLVRAGAMVYDSTGGSRGVYVYTGPTFGWIKLYDTLMTVISPNFYSTDGTTSGARAVNLGGNLTFSGHNTRSITFDSVNAFTASRNGITRISFNSGNTSIFNGTGLGGLVLSSGQTQLVASGGIDIDAPLTDITGGTAVIGLRDSIYIRVPSAGDIRIYPLNHSLVATGKMMVWDSLNGQVSTRAIPAGGSTPTLQQVLTAGSTLTLDNGVSGSGTKDLNFTGFDEWGAKGNDVYLDTETGGSGRLRGDGDTIVAWNSANLWFPKVARNAAARNVMLVIDSSTGLAAYQDIASGGGVTTMAAIGSTPNANGATITGVTLNLEPASASFGGVTTTAGQTFAGLKRFNGNINVGTSLTDYGVLEYNNGTGVLRLGNTYDAAVGNIEFVTRISGTPVTGLTITGAGIVIPKAMTIGTAAANPALLGFANSTDQNGYIEYNGTSLIFYTANSTWLTINGTGGLRAHAYGAGALNTDASGNITAVSDETLKYIQGIVGAGLKEIKKINPIRYKWRPESGMETSHTYSGFSAQNILEALGPEATGINQKGELSIQDRAIMGAMINAIKELSAKVDYLEAELKKKK